MSNFQFRGISTDTGEWVYGYGVVFSPENEIYQIIHKQGQHLTQHTQVRPESVGDCTGRHDKNGKEIWRGDIFKLEGSNFIFKVVFEDFSFVIYNRYGKWGQLSRLFDGDIADLSNKIVVIGNIYEHSNVLGKVTKGEIK